MVNNAGVPTWPGRPSQPALSNTNTPKDSVPYRWEVGGPSGPDAGSYSTNQAQVAFVADSPAQRVGVSDLQTTGYMHNTYAQSPQLSWTYAAATRHLGGLDSINIGDYKDQGLLNGDPIATNRCTGRSGFCITSLIAFQNGVIATAGSNTSPTRLR